MEAHNEEVEEVKKIMVEEMQGAASLDVPLETEVNMGYNWYEAK